MQLTGQFFDEIERNMSRIPRMQAPDIPVQLIWSRTDAYINTGAARGFEVHLKYPSSSPGMALRPWAGLLGQTEADLPV